MDGRKSYRFTLRWGQATETDDAEGRICEEHPHRPDAAQIEAALAAFTGGIEQTPPLYSAIKVGGQRAYGLARAETVFELKTRRDTLYTIGARKSIVQGRSVSVRVDPGGRRIIKKKKH